MAVDNTFVLPDTIHLKNTFSKQTRKYLMIQSNDHSSLFQILDRLNDDERNRLSPAATFSDQGIRRTREERVGHRQSFALDADRILHSRAYTRYIDKTQVFCLIDNDHITHRVLHVQLVARIARTIGRFLYLNEDLIEAIALGHDIGHPPFGHDGEKILSKLCAEHGLPPFQHNIQSIRFLDHLERKGRGWNLNLQTLDGILCHDGEIFENRSTPEPLGDFEHFDKKLTEKERNPAIKLQPMTLEACVVRISDTVAYIGRDIEDAIILGMIKRSDIPRQCRETLGDTNGSIVYTLVTDIINASSVPQPGSTNKTDQATIRFSEKIGDALRRLKQFNYQNIYHHPQTKKHLVDIESCFITLFHGYLDQLKNSTHPIDPEIDLMTDITQSYTDEEIPAAMIRDFIGGMTDDFFLKQASRFNCNVPQKQ